jgi:hypothetical protein
MARNVMPKIIAVLAAVFGLVALSVHYRAAASHLSAPSDDTLIKTFQSHRDNFERLRQMATEAMHQMSSFSESTISTALPESRRNEYKNLLKVSPGLVVGANYDGSIRFIFVSDESMAIGPGWAKGIQFIPAEAKPIGSRTDNLDDTQKLPAGVYLREIEPRWFVFYQRDE